LTLTVPLLSAAAATAPFLGGDAALAGCAAAGRASARIPNRSDAAMSLGNGRLLAGGSPIEGLLGLDRAEAYYLAGNHNLGGGVAID
jgi:hypothetical protein